MRMLLTLLGLGLFLTSPGRAEDVQKDSAAKKYQIPYRLTIPKHILVRAKINGKGPFNFILDTGAPALFVSTKACKKLGLEPDDKGWGTFDRFEIEGGLVIPKARGRIEDPFQLEGMNGLGLAGAELHGVIGYNILAKYRMEIDFTRDKMTWTDLRFEPEAPWGLGAKGGSQGGMEIIGTLMKAFGSFMGRKANPDLVPRGFLGLDASEDDKGATIVRSLLSNGPAAEAGLKVGDQILKVKGRSVYGLDGLQQLTRNMTSGEKVLLTIQRGKDSKPIEITLTTGEGL